MLPAEFPPSLELIWADGGYRGSLIEWVEDNFDTVLEIIKRNDDVKALNYYLNDGL